MFVQFKYDAHFTLHLHIEQLKKKNPQDKRVKLEQKRCKFSNASTKKSTKKVVRNQPLEF